MPPTTSDVIQQTPFAEDELHDFLRVVDTQA